jgi:hypothetical protein
LPLISKVGAVAISSVRDANSSKNGIKAFCIIAEDITPNLYQEALNAKEGALNEIRKLIESIGH